MDFETLLILTFAVVCMTLGGVFVILKDYKLQINDLVNLAKKNQKPRATFIDGEKALIIANAAYKSLKNKKIVKIK